MKNPNRIYTVLHCLVAPHLKNYHSDLTKHDKNSIKDDTNFIHITRDNGTHLIKFHKADVYPQKGKDVSYMLGKAYRETILKSAKTSLNYILSQPYNLILFYDGESIKEISPAQVTGKLNQYTKAILNKWKKEEILKLKK